MKAILIVTAAFKTPTASIGRPQTGVRNKLRRHLVQHCHDGHFCLLQRVCVCCSNDQNSLLSKMTFCPRRIGCFSSARPHGGRLFASDPPAQLVTRSFIITLISVIMPASQPRRSEREKKGRIIPIPSFSCVSPSAPATPPSKPSTMIKAPKWNESCLSNAEGALFINRVRRGATLWSPDGLLRLDDFYYLCRQLKLVETSPKEAPADPDGLTLPERLLCDLICVSSPSLYRLVQNEHNVWCLEMVKYKGNRLAHLCSLMNRPELEDAKRDATLKTILEHRSLPKNDIVKNQAPVKMNVEENTVAPQKVIMEPFIRDGMTLEDRVRARSQARQQRQADSTSKKNSGKPDYSSLLRLADAMWSHSRHHLRRQSRISRRPVARYGMTVKEVVNLFSGSLVTSSSKTRQLHREKASRTEMLKALRELHQLVPEWISFSSADLSKDTTVWLSATADTAAVRSKLGAPTGSKRPMRPVDSNKKAPARVSLSPADKANDTVSYPSPPKKQRRSPRLSTTRKACCTRALFSHHLQRKRKAFVSISTLF